MSNLALGPVLFSATGIEKETANSIVCVLKVAGSPNKIVLSPFVAVDFDFDSDLSLNPDYMTSLVTVLSLPPRQVVPL